MPRLRCTDLDIFPLCLGGNVFRWTADERESFAILDAYAAAGGNFIDTADSYSAWVRGHVGRRIGKRSSADGWPRAALRHKMIIATKVGRPGAAGLAATIFGLAQKHRLKRLGVDRIDLYYAHADDPATPIEHSLREFDALVRDGKLRYVAASNSPRRDWRRRWRFPGVRV